MAQKRTAAPVPPEPLHGRERDLSEIVGGSLRIAGRKRVESFLTKDIVEIEVTNGRLHAVPVALRLGRAA
ncbi:hypothetical protein ACRAWD_22985 [Caulobacter segnis]